MDDKKLREILLAYDWRMGEKATVEAITAINALERKPSGITTEWLIDELFKCGATCIKFEGVAKVAESINRKVNAKKPIEITGEMVGEAITVADELMEHELNKIHAYWLDYIAAELIKIIRGE